MGAAVVLGQGLAEGAGAVGNGAAADLAAGEGQVGDGDREAAGLCRTHLLLLCHHFPAASARLPGLACGLRQMKMPAGQAGPLVAVQACRAGWMGTTAMGVSFSRKRWGPQAGSHVRPAADRRSMASLSCLHQHISQERARNRKCQEICRFRGSDLIMRTAAFAIRQI